jgi:uncharacterized protein
MPIRKHFQAILIAVAILGSTGCGSDVDSAQAGSEPDAVATSGVDSLAQLPPDRIYGASSAENLWSPRFELTVRGLPEGWNGARLAILSDFQLGLWEENEEVARRAIQRAVEARPHLIVLLGDYLAVGEDPAPLARVLAPLRGQRAIAVLGDRDIRTDSTAARTARILQGLGVSVLRNSVLPVDLGAGIVNVAGLDPELLTAAAGEQQWVIGTLGEPGAVPILLTHAPGLAARVPAGRYQVILAGHTFCGQVEVPGTPRLSWLATEVFPSGGVEVSEQLFRIQGATVLVTCGLGYGFVPLRFGAAPEVPILTLVRAEDHSEPPTPADSAAAGPGSSGSRQSQPSVD